MRSFKNSPLFYIILRVIKTAYQMEQNLQQDFTLWLSKIYEKVSHFFNQQEVSASMVIILVLALLYYTIREMWKKGDDFPQTKILPSKSVQNYQKLKPQQKAKIQIAEDSEKVLRKKLIQQHNEAVPINRQNDKKKAKLGSKQFFEKKSKIFSNFKRPQSKLSDRSIQQKQEEEERRRIVQEQSKKKTQVKGRKYQFNSQEKQQKKNEAKNQQPIIEKKQQNRFPSFGNINIPSNKQFMFTQSFGKDSLIEKGQQKQKRLPENVPADKSTVIAEKTIQSKIDQTTNINNSFGFFGNNQPSLFTQDTSKTTLQINKATNQPPKPTLQMNKATIITPKPQINAPQPLINIPITQPTNNLLNVTNNNIQIANQEIKSNPPNTIKIPQAPKKQQTIITVPKPAQNKIPILANPSRPQPSPVVRSQQKLTSQELLDSYIKYVDNVKKEVQNKSIVQNLMGARSSPNDILMEAKSLLASIDKNDDKQLTAYALRLYRTIVYNFISTSNIKSGLERIPARQKAKQIEKNSINAYILCINMYRLMDPCKKIWVIVFGKILKMMSFLYKRKEDLQSFHKLELIQCGYIQKYKEMQSKYVSRMDFLTYFLLGLTAFDPIFIAKQVETKDPNVQESRAEMQSWGNKWSYSQFWSLVNAVLNNKHESYSKPIFFMNLLYVLYPKIYEYKMNPALYKQEYDLYLIVISKAKAYMKAFPKMKEMQILSQTYQDDEYEYDGPDLVKTIKVLDSRFTEKDIQIKMKAKEFEARNNVFYYFTKDK